ncbi:NrsF family protein [Devosia sp. CAU 1758]
MTDDLIARLSSDLKPVPPRALERRLWTALAVGIAGSLLLGPLFLDLVMGRPFGGAWGSAMFWGKLAFTLGLGLLGLIAVPALSRPDGRLVWPLLAAVALALSALAMGTMGWMQADWAMPMLMGGTALVCPWLIILTAAPMLAMLLGAMRRFAPASPTLAGLAAGLLAGGFGAAAYAFYCGETSMMFMAVWYSLGIALTALLGAVLGRFLLRW